MRFAAYAVLAAVLLSSTPTDAQTRGAFVAFDGKTKKWAPVFKQMKAAGMDTAILQYTRTTDGYFYDKETDAFICAAEKAGMNYYLGLRYHQSWDGKPESVSTYVNDSIDLMTVQLPPKLKKAKAKFFKGWYMALEVGNDEEAVKETAKLKAIAAKKSGQDIAMSVYFNPHIKEGKLPAKKFAETIQDTIAAYDVVLFQDSVGRHGAPAAAMLKEYYEEIDEVYPGQLWIIVEAFRGQGTATEKAFAKQIDNALALNEAGNIAAFEFLKNFFYPKSSGALAAWKAKFAPVRP